tara:strand:- start:1337 stop:1777 length:441 start_codon:yes stop_codon:yes gene_type:complete
MKNVTLTRGSESDDLNNIEILPIVEQSTIDTCNEDCPICMEKLTADKNICITRCGHKFCSECLIRSARSKNSCPLCRQALTEHEIDTQHDFTNAEVYALIDDNDYYEETFEQLRDIFAQREPRFNPSPMNVDSDDEDITITGSIEV